MDFILEHFEWIFSGIGVSMIGLLINHFSQKKKKKGDNPEIDVTKSNRIKISNNEKSNISVTNSQRVTIEGNKNGK